MMHTRATPADLPGDLGDFTTEPRMLAIATMAVGLGISSTVLAKVLLNLIEFFTNVFFYQTFDLVHRSPAAHTLGGWVIAVPIAGALLIGLMARYGSERIRGHGI